MKKEFELPIGAGIHIFAILFLLVFALISSGCRSVKETVNAKTTVQEESVVKSIDQKKSNDIDSARTVKNLSSETKDSSFTKVTDIWLSKPDSSGIQHIERMTITESGNIKQSAKDYSEEMRTASNRNEDSKHESIATSETTVKDKQLLVTKQESVTKWPLIIFSIGLLVLAYFVLKRFRILK